MPTKNTFDVLGVPISVTNMADALKQIVDATKRDSSSVVFVRDVNSLMQAVRDPVLLAWHQDNFLTVPDGMPLVLYGRWHLGIESVGRVAGADLMASLACGSDFHHLRHYFYGGRRGVVNLVINALRRANPNLKVAGAFTPPMRDVEEIGNFGEDLASEVDQICSAKADIIWVGLSSPKQEYFMMNAMRRLNRGVMIGVGAAFDFHAGTVDRAPRWMQASCLEWLHRLYSDPKRLWKRYVLIGPKFLIYLALAGLLPGVLTIKERVKSRKSRQDAALFTLIREDIAANRRNPRGLLICVLYRLAHSVLSYPAILRPVGYIYLAFYKVLTEYILCTEIHWRATVGGGMHISHGFGLVIHSGAVIGKHCLLRQGVTIGVAHTGNHTDVPIVGDNVEFGANSIVIGKLTVGSGATIGAGAVVVSTVPANAVVVGNPAVVKFRRKKSELDAM